MSWLKNPITALVEGVAGVFKTRQERKKAAETGKNKLAMLKEQNATSVTLTDAEGEAILADKTDSTWKDEYALLLITFPILLIMLGTVVFIFNGDDRLLQAGYTSIKNLQEAGIPMDFLMEAVILSSVGLKIWRKI